MGKTDRDGHGGAGRALGVGADLVKHGNPELLTQRREDGAHKQRGKKALGHGAQSINQVALNRYLNIFAFEEPLDFVHAARPFSYGFEWACDGQELCAKMLGVVIRS